METLTEGEIQNYTMVFIALVYMRIIKGKQMQNAVKAKIVNMHIIYMNIIIIQKNSEKLNVLKKKRVLIARKGLFVLMIMKLILIMEME